MPHLRVSWLSRRGVLTALAVLSWIGCVGDLPATPRPGDGSATIATIGGDADLPGGPEPSLADNPDAEIEDAVSMEIPDADSSGPDEPTQAMPDAPLVVTAVDARGAVDAPTDAPAPTTPDTAGIPPTEKTGNGQPCSAGTTCVSGFCTDGVCCESACTGQCEACAEAGSAGHCLAVDGAPRGTRASCAGQGSCAGRCDVSRRESCTYPGMATECAAGHCENDSATSRSVCDGAGKCLVPTSVPCDGKGCSGAVCSGGCTSSVQCLNGKYCDAGRCLDKLTNGRNCTMADQCSSGQCVGGLCCDRACTGDCESCWEVGKVGTCSPRQTGTPCRLAKGPCDIAEVCDGQFGVCPTDKVALSGMTCRAPVGDCDQAEACDGASPACPLDKLRDAAAICRPAQGGCDAPEYCTGTSSTCPADVLLPPSSTCRPIAGTCDLPESCTGTSKDCPADAFKDSGTACLTAACTPDGYVPGKNCSGTAAACPPSPAIDCGRYMCTPTGCKANCTNQSDCIASAWCTVYITTPPGYGTCEAKRPDGDYCTSMYQCQAGVCGSFYTDNDHDGYGVQPSHFCGTTPPANYASNPGDCCDSDAKVKPGQTSFFSLKNACGNSDYDCNGTEELWYTNFGCPNGWVTMPAPGCGQMAQRNGPEIRPGVCMTEYLPQACR
jgi:hypothetical protein